MGIIFLSDFELLTCIMIIACCLQIYIFPFPFQKISWFYQLVALRNYDIFAYVWSFVSILLSIQQILLIWVLTTLRSIKFLKIIILMFLFSFPPEAPKNESPDYSQFFALSYILSACHLFFFSGSSSNLSLNLFVGFLYFSKHIFKSCVFLYFFILIHLECSSHISA